MLVTVQPFGLKSVSGGSRILNALFDDPPMPVHSICTTPELPKEGLHASETHIRQRPPLGRLDFSRYTWVGAKLDRPFAHANRRKLRSQYRELGASAVHLVAHGYAFSAAYLAAKDLGLPVILTVHDDLRYTLRGHPDIEQALETLGEAWRDSATRIVICEELGEEYCARYGQRPFIVVTDGLECLTPISESIDGTSHVLYFMGLLHIGYLATIEHMLQAMHKLCLEGETWHLILRCGLSELPFDPSLTQHVTLLPFGSQQDVEQDMLTATALYQPLAFGAEYDDMNRFSLSTKMVTYLGAGKPIFFHGPANSAASLLLGRWHAATTIDNLDPLAISLALTQCKNNGLATAENAQKLARDRFMLSDQRSRFWESVSTAVAQ